MSDYVDVVCADGSTYRWYRPMAQGAAHLLDAEEQALDDHGLTNPDLHRRIDPQEPTSADEKAPRQYYLEVCGVRSYRTTIINTHDEDSNEDEIP